jgi:hypothetical protein
MLPGKDKALDRIEFAPSAKMFVGEPDPACRYPAFLPLMGLIGSPSPTNIRIGNAFDTTF